MADWIQGQLWRFLFAFLRVSLHVPRIRRVQTAQPDCMWVQGECWCPQPWSSHGSLLQWGCDVPSFNIPWLYNRRWVMSWGSPCSSSPSVCLSVSPSHIWISEERLLVFCLPYICSPSSSCASTKRHPFWTESDSKFGNLGNLLPLCAKQAERNVSGV